MRSVLQDGAGGIREAGFGNRFSLASCSSGANRLGRRKATAHAQKTAIKRPLRTAVWDFRKDTYSSNGVA